MRPPDFSPLSPENLKFLAVERTKALAQETREIPLEAKPVFYPRSVRRESNNVRLESRRIAHNAEVVGNHYAEFLPERNLSAAFQETLNDVAQHLQQKFEQTNDSLYQNALAELRLLTEVDRLFFENDFEHLRLPQNFDRTPQGLMINVELTGINLNDGIEARWANWCVSATGIRLTISCYDRIQRKDFEVQARMDFHYRGKEETKSENKQAALDLEGIFLTPAIRTFKGRKGESDYHRAHFLDKVIKSDTDFATICEGRQRQIQEALNKYWREQGVVWAG